MERNIKSLFLSAFRILYNLLPGRVVAEDISNDNGTSRQSKGV